MKSFQFLRKIQWVLILVGLTLALSAHGGVFNLPHFIEPSQFGLGIEPEITTSNGAGLGINLKYIQGISTLSNFTGTLGTGSGPRRFRAGGAVTFDFYPDLKDQPGIGLGLSGLFVQLPHAGSVELSAIPYIHKTFQPSSAVLEPFLAVPFGLSLSNGTYEFISQLVLGHFFRHHEHFSSVVELGVDLTHANTYLSGGLIYFY